MCWFLDPPNRVVERMPWVHLVRLMLARPNEMIEVRNLTFPMSYKGTLKELVEPTHLVSLPLGCHPFASSMKAGAPFRLKIAPHPLRYLALGTPIAPGFVVLVQLGLGWGSF